MLDDIAGVGPSRRKALLNYFGSLNKVKQASREELQEVQGVGPALAKEIREYLERNLRP
jgi:excinuclease ABC subunit C